MDTTPQAMSAKKRRVNGKEVGNNVRQHNLSPEAIVDIVNKLDDPSMIIYQTNRHDKSGNDLPNNVVVFVEYTANGNESIAIIEFESSIDSEFIGTEFGDTNYHTVVTVFDPDIERDGMPFDYAEELLSNPNNIELTIEKRHPARSATREKHPNTSSNMPSANSISQNAQNVNSKNSLSSESGEKRCILGRCGTR